MLLCRAKSFIFSKNLWKGGQDRVFIFYGKTINPIPGLFYEIVSGNSFDAHGDLVIDHEAEKGTSQATTAADKTVSIPMTFSDGKKVKYYKVSVKATK